MPSPSIYCAAAAARTRRLRIGTMGNIVPLYDPLRIAEDAAVLDNVANGRFELGLVSGIVPDFFGPYRADFQNRRALTHEALLFIKQALSSDGAFSFTGESRQYRKRHPRRKTAAKTPSADLDSLARRRHAGVARARRRAHRLSVSWCRAAMSRRAIANIYGCGMKRVTQANRTSATGCSSMSTRPTPKPSAKAKPYFEYCFTNVFGTRADGGIGYQQTGGKPRQTRQSRRRRDRAARDRCRLSDARATSPSSARRKPSSSKSKPPPAKACSIPCWASSISARSPRKI